MNQPIHVAKIETGELVTFPAELVDLSTTGCALRGDVHLAPADRVSVAMNLDGTEIRVAGEVARTWRPETRAQLHAGVDFDAITPDQAGSIRRFLLDQFRQHQVRR